MKHDHTDPPLRVALIGAGGRANVHLRALDCLAAEGVLRLVAVADINHEAAAAVAAPRNATAYKDPQTLLDNEEIDAVYLVVPYNLHPALVAMILSRDKHLFVEKPLAIQVADAVALGHAARQARAKGVLTCVGYQHRYGQDVEYCRSILEETPPVLIAGHWYQGMPPTQWGRSFANNGGQVFAQLTHQLDLARDLVGEVTTVYAACDQLARVTAEDEAEGFDNWDVYALTLRFANGAIGSFHSTYALFRGLAHAQDLRVIGRERFMRLEKGQLELSQPGPSGIETNVVASSGDAELAMHRRFAEAIRTHDAQLVRSPVEDAVLTSAVCAAANISAQTRQTIDMQALLREHGWV